MCIYVKCIACKTKKTNPFLFSLVLRAVEVKTANYFQNKYSCRSKQFNVISKSAPSTFIHWSSALLVSLSFSQTLTVSLSVFIYFNLFRCFFPSIFSNSATQRMWTIRILWDRQWNSQFLSLTVSTRVRIRQTNLLMILCSFDFFSLSRPICGIYMSQSLWFVNVWAEWVAFVCLRAPSACVFVFARARLAHDCLQYQVRRQ